MSGHQQHSREEVPNQFGREEREVLPQAQHSSGCTCSSNRNFSNFVHLFLGYLMTQAGVARSVLSLTVDWLTRV